MDNLLEAIIYGDISYVKWILKYNIDINTPDSNKITYLQGNVRELRPVCQGITVIDK